ncbi:hypothetical protein OROGR_005404 [Orobanche gracilis]
MILNDTNLITYLKNNEVLVDFRFGKKLSDERTFTICGMADSLAPEIVLGKGHGFPADCPSHRMAFVNGMWADKSVSLSHSFKQLVATHYKVTMASVDFLAKFDQVRHEVNSWVERETNGLITELLPPEAVGRLTRLFFANALCFKGAWKHKFDTAAYGDFHLLNGTSIEVLFMKSKKKERFISAFDGFKVLRLSYKQGRDKNRRFSMYIFLPDAKDGLSALIEKLASESDFLKGKLPQRKVRVFNFRIPKFRISFTLEASNVLKELGVVLPFSEWDANFTKMDSSLDGEYVESMFQKASIEVNEEGTEAATANSMLKTRMQACCTPRSGIDFVADHPFLFLIREDMSGTILFIGKVLDPLDGAATLEEGDLRTKYEGESSDFEAEDWEEVDASQAKRKRSSTLQP